MYIYSILGYLLCCVKSRPQIKAATVERTNTYIFTHTHIYIHMYMYIYFNIDAVLDYLLCCVKSRPHIEAATVERTSESPTRMIASPLNCVSILETAWEGKRRQHTVTIVVIEQKVNFG